MTFHKNMLICNGFIIITLKWINIYFLTFSVEFVDSRAKIPSFEVNQPHFFFFFFLARFRISSTWQLHECPSVEGYSPIQRSLVYEIFWSLFLGSTPVCSLFLLPLASLRSKTLRGLRSFERVLGVLGIS